ncbi:hypothetical protein ADK35_02200 [Streptomyces viridochromogenes]|uniref:hypothetical protein n=1 Tax=Streptomyces viridochromogenes TaxID=1938 RepID=UPI00069E2E1B|nr:hypothetical protein [Streptomyces viridochromogenes]KOG29522.1 hypothetical protein ADK35_02200 [Streptomyces viridochromogenes]
MTVVLPHRTLPDEMAYLLPTTAPDAWRAAVARAAQLLAPSWDERPNNLKALSFIVLTLAVEREQPPESLPLQAVTEELSAQGEEPQDLSQRIKAAGTTAGVLGNGYGPDTLDTVWTDLSSWLEAPGEPMGDAPGHPPALWAAVGRLHEAISGLDAASIRQAPVPLPSPGALTISVGRHVQVVSTNAIRPITCDTCASCEGGSLRVDGPAVTFVCAEGHTTADHRLEVRRVRNALVHADVPIRADVAVEGDFLVTSRAYDEQSDPRSLSRFTAALLA